LRSNKLLFIILKTIFFGMRNFYFLMLCLLGMNTANAQYNLHFLDPQINAAGRFQVTLALSSTAGFSCGTTNFRFNVASAEINGVTADSDAFPSPDFGSTTTTGSNTSGTISINTAYNGAADANLVPIGATPVPLVTVSFNILNGTATSVTPLTWRTTTTPKSVVIDDNKLTTLVAGTANNIASFSLPIELKSITAVENGKVNDVMWETAMEQNVRAFVVEKSNDGFSWAKLGEKNPSPSMRYTMRDATPFKVTYYRVRSVDNDGAEQVSKIVVVNRKTDGKFNFNVTPNPVVDNTKLYFESGIKGAIVTTLIGSNGQIVETYLTSAVNATNVIDLDMANIPAGTYIINVTDGTNTAAEVLVKQ
jgi:hypothetical protein